MQAKLIIKAPINAIKNRFSLDKEFSVHVAALADAGIVPALLVGGLGRPGPVDAVRLAGLSPAP